MSKSKRFIIKCTTGVEEEIEAFSFTDALIQYNSDISNKGKVVQDIWKRN